MFNKKSIISFALITSMLAVYAPVPVGAEEEAEDLVLQEEKYSHGFVQPDITAPGLATNSNGNINLLKSSSIPESYDARDYGYVTSVKNQGNYGTCWTFANAATMESYAITHGYATKDDIDLSEAEIVRASYYSKDINSNITGIENDYVNGLVGSNTAYSFVDGGGNSYYSYLSLSSAGIMSESNWAYSSGNGCFNSYYDTEKVDYILTGLKRIPSSDTSAIKKAIMENGAIQAAYYDDNEYRAGTGYYYNYYVESTNHAITIVGWNDNMDKSNFTVNGNTPTNNGAWLIKNSWGNASVLSDGYMWISYEDKGISYEYSDFASYEIVPADTYDNIYQNDGCTFDGCCYVTGIANIFTVPESANQQNISAVSFYTFSSSINYSIQLYDVTDTSDITSGTPLMDNAVTGTTTYSGYYTIPLASDVVINPGDTFAAVISFNSSVEVPLSATESTLYLTNSSNDNESYVRTGLSTGYFDLYDSSGEYNVPVKVFTNDVSESGLSTPEITSITSDTNSITLEYRNVTGATAYEIFRSSDGSTYEKVKTTSETEYKDTDLTMGKCYYYKIRAYDGTNYSAYSQIKSCTVDYTIPQASVSTNITDKTATVSWTGISSATKYNIYLSYDDNTYTLLDNTTSTNYTLSYKNNVTYYFKVSAVYADDCESDKSTACYACEQVNLNPEVTYDSMYNYTISWDEDPDATGYRVSLDGNVTNIPKGTTTYSSTYTEDTLGEWEDYEISSYTTYDNIDFESDSEEASVYHRYEPITITRTNIIGSLLTVYWDSFSEGISAFSYSGKRYAMYYSNDGLNYTLAIENYAGTQFPIYNYDYTKDYYIIVVVEYWNDPIYGTYQVTMPQSTPTYIAKIDESTEAVTPTVRVTGGGSAYTGDTVTLSASVCNSQYYGSYTYQWYKMSSSTDTTGTAISGATSSTYTPSTQNAGTYYYTCKVTHKNYSSEKTGTGNIVTVGITGAVTPTVTVTGPSTLVAGNSGTYTATVSDKQSYGTYSYQWYWNSTNNMSGAKSISGATSSTLTCTNSTVGNNYYICVVTHNVGTSTASKSASTSTTVYAKCVTPTVTVSGAGTYTVGDTVTLTASISKKESFGTYSYQWYNGSTAIKGATSTTYKPSTSSAGTITYKCIVTHTGNGTGNSTSGYATAKVVVNAKVTAPTTITSSTTNVNQDTLMISNITPGATAGSLNNTVNENSYTQIMKDGKAVSSSTTVATGMTMCIVVDGKVTKTYTIIVTGDTNGDGKANITDMIAIKSKILNKSNLSGAYAKAADVNGDGKVNITDFIKVKAAILGKDKITGVTAQ